MKREGDKVILKANEAEGWKRQEAIVLEYEGKDTYLVSVESEGEEDDGLREVTSDQFEE